MLSYLQTLKRHWAQHFISQSSGFIILFITYSAVLLIASGLYNTQRIFDQWGEISQLRVYSHEANQLDSLSEALKSSEIVASAEIVKSDRSAQSFVDRFSKLGGETLKTQDLVRFFPNYINLELQQAQVGAQGLASIEASVKSLMSQFQEIKEIKYGRDWLSRYMSLFQVTQWLGWLLIGIFMIAATVVSSSVIKTLMFHHQDEIQVMDFIGADDRQIYVPHIISIFTLSAVAFSLAVIFNLVILSLVGQFLSERLGALTEIQMAPLSIILSVLSLCLMTSLASGYFTIYRLLPKTGARLSDL